MESTFFFCFGFSAAFSLEGSNATAESDSERCHGAQCGQIQISWRKVGFLFSLSQQCAEFSKDECRGNKQ